jgi:hypothetical protein
MTHCRPRPGPGGLAWVHAEGEQQQAEGDEALAGRPHAPALRHIPESAPRRSPPRPPARPGQPARPAISRPHHPARGPLSLLDSPLPTSCLASHPGPPSRARCQGWPAEPPRPRTSQPEGPTQPPGPGPIDLGCCLFGPGVGCSVHSTARGLLGMCCSWSQEGGGGGLGGCTLPSALCRTRNCACPDSEQSFNFLFQSSTFTCTRSFGPAPGPLEYMLH